MDSSLSRTGYKSSARHVYWFTPVVIVLVFAVAWMARASILRVVAHLWVVSDALDRADAIVILGGRVDVRPFAAAALYKRGLAPQVLVSKAKAGPIHPLQLLPSQIELTRQILSKLGVPQQAIVEFGGDGSSNTYEEARAVLDWARISGARSVIIPTDIFTSRRIRWIFRRQLAPASVRVMVQSVAPPEYSIDDWWRHESGVIEFQNEVIKYLYYRLKY